MEREEKKVYFVLEYEEKLTKKMKSIFVRSESQESLDIQTENFQTKEQLANLYYTWFGAHAEGALSSLKDIYSVNINTKLGKYLTAVLNVKKSLSGLDDLSVEHITITNRYMDAKNCSLKNRIKFLQDKNDTREGKVIYAADRTPIIQMPEKIKTK